MSLSFNHTLVVTMTKIRKAGSMAEVFSGNISLYREDASSVYDDIFSSLPEAASVKRDEIIEEIQTAIFGDGRISNKDEVTIDGRVSLIGNNYAVSLNAFNLGKDMPESISIGIVSVNKDDFSLKHRYSRDRQEIEIETNEAKSREDIKMLSFAEVTDTLTGRGMTLTHVEGSDAAYRIVGPDDVAHGELIGMRGDGEELEGAYINNFHTGDFLTVENKEQLDEIFRSLIPESSRDTVELKFSEEEMEESFEEARAIDEVLSDDAVAEQIEDIYNRTGDMDTLVSSLGELYPEGLSVENDEGLTVDLPVTEMKKYAEEKGIKADSVIGLEQGLTHELVNDLNRKVEERSAAEKVMEDVIMDNAAPEITPLDEYLDSIKDGVYIKVDDEQSFGLNDPEMVRSMIDELGITGKSVGEYADKVAHALRNEYEKTLEKEVAPEKTLMPELKEGMSEREMREACINFINKGAEPSPEQLDFINCKGERESVEIKEEIEFLKSQKEQIKEEIERNETKLEALNKDLGKHITFAKMNGCEGPALDNIRQDINFIQKTTQNLDNKRESLADIELKMAELRAEKNRALSREMAMSVRSRFQAAQDTLKKGVDYGIGTLDKIKGAFERVNDKVADMKDIHEKKAAYASLSSEIDAVNKEYIQQISEVRREYDRNLQKLSKVMERAERQAMLKGAFKDLCRIALHKEPQYDYSLNDKQQGRINEIREMISENRKEMEDINAAYESIIPQMENDLKDISSGLEAKGVDAGRSVLSGVAETRAERSAAAKELLNDTKKEIKNTSRDDDYER